MKTFILAALAVTTLGLSVVRCRDDSGSSSAPAKLLQLARWRRLMVLSGSAPARTDIITHEVKSIVRRIAACYRQISRGGSRGSPDGQSRRPAAGSATSTKSYSCQTKG
jgi:hypothetical protein